MSSLRRRSHRHRHQRHRPLALIPAAVALHLRFDPKTRAYLRFGTGHTAGGGGGGEGWQVWPGQFLFVFLASPWVRAEARAEARAGVIASAVGMALGHGADVRR
jgi:hypothetical protein